MKEKSIRCSCIGGDHYLNIMTFEKTKDEPEQIYVDLMAKSDKSIKSRLREAWKILRGNDSCYDGIILNKEKCFEIIEFFQDFWKDAD